MDVHHRWHRNWLSQLENQTERWIAGVDREAGRADQEALCAADSSKSDAAEVTAAVGLLTFKTICPGTLAAVGNTAPLPRPVLETPGTL